MKRLLLPALFALSLPVVAQEASISGVSPDAATLGTVVEILGSDFGTARPKVFLTQEGTNAKTRLKVSEWAEDRIVAELKKAKGAGPAILHVQPKGKGLAEATAGFELLAPTILDVDAEMVAPNDEATMLVANLGNKKPKLRVGGKKAKVLAIEPALAEGVLSVDEITFKVPGALANGAWDVEVVNKIAANVLAGAVLVTGSDKKIGKPVFTATINGAPFKTGGKKLGSQAGGPAVVGIVATNGFSPTIGFTFTVPVTDPAEVPKTYTALPTNLVYTETTLSGGGFVVQSWLPVPGGSLSVTVNAVSGGQMAASFSANLKSAGLEDRDVEGDFIVDL